MPSETLLNFDLSRFRSFLSNLKLGSGFVWAVAFSHFSIEGPFFGAGGGGGGGGGGHESGPHITLWSVLPVLSVRLRGAGVTGKP